MWEWNLDWYQSPYRSGNNCNDCSDLIAASYGVARGGSWYFEASSLFAAYRLGFTPNYRYGLVGARCARTP